jgi:hypothetical protein
MKPIFATLILFIGFVLAALNPAEARPIPGTPQFEKMRDATVAAFNVYLDGKEKAVSAFDSGEIGYPELLKRRISYLKRIDTRSADPRLAEYFETIVKEFKETQPIADQAWAEAQNADKGLNAANSMFGSLATDPLSFIVAYTMNDQIQQGVEDQYKARWMPEIQRIRDKYEPIGKVLLRDLGDDYQYSFYSIVYGDEE